MQTSAVDNGKKPPSRVRFLARPVQEEEQKVFQFDSEHGAGCLMSEEASLFFSQVGGKFLFMNGAVLLTQGRDVTHHMRITTVFGFASSSYSCSFFFQYEPHHIPLWLFHRFELFPESS